MTKRLFLLTGLAIVAVVCHHAGAWGYTAMFWWTDRYRPVSVPNFDQLGNLPYYVLLVIRQLTVFSVPAFLFVSGFFIAYAARGTRSGSRWKTVLVRIGNLLVPYLLWSGVIFVGDALQGIRYTPLEYIEKLSLGKATGAYFYVPLLCQFYVLSPLVTSLAKVRGGLTLLVSALLQFGVLSLRYLDAYGVNAPVLAAAIRMTPDWSFPAWALFFTLGLVFGFHLGRAKGWLSRFKWGLLVAVVALGLLAVLEPQVPRDPGGYEWERSLHSISSQLYALAVVLCFVAFEKITIPCSTAIHQLGRNSYGIYLLHPKVLEFFARAVRQITPWILGYQVIFSSLLVMVGIGTPLLFMTAVSKSPTRRYYRYLFG